MSVVLPTVPGSSNYEYTLELDQQAYRFVFRWNERDGAWYFDLFDSDDAVIAAGCKIVVGYPLLARVRNAAKPRGILQAIDTSGADVECGFADLGERVKLVYTSEGEYT